MILNLEEDKILNADKVYWRFECPSEQDLLQMRILPLKSNRLRNKVYNDAEAAGKLWRGFYSMTVLYRNR